MVSRMFHNFTFFEIKNAWGLIRWDFDHNQRKKNFFVDRTLFRGRPAPRSLKFLIAGQFAGKVRYLLNGTR